MSFKRIIASLLADICFLSAGGVDALNGRAVMRENKCKVVGVFKDDEAGNKVGEDLGNVFKELEIIFGILDRMKVKSEESLARWENIWRVFLPVGGAWGKDSIAIIKSRGAVGLTSDVRFFRILDKLARSDISEARKSLDVFLGDVMELGKEIDSSFVSCLFISALCITCFLAAVIVCPYVSMPSSVVYFYALFVSSNRYFSNFEYRKLQNCGREEILRRLGDIIERLRKDGDLGRLG